MLWLQMFTYETSYICVLFCMYVMIVFKYLNKKFFKIAKLILALTVLLLSVGLRAQIFILEKQ